MKTLTTFYKDLRGSAALEFAFIIPAYLFFIFGIVEFGYVLWGNTALKYGAANGARYAFVHPTASSAEVENVATSSISFPGDAIEYSVAIAPNVSATIDGTFTYNFLGLPINPITVTTQIVQPLPIN